MWVIKRLFVYSKSDLLPPWLKQKNIPTSKWHLSDFQWADPVGNIDNIESFLSFRKNKMNIMLGS
jgi:hypothetical protein